MTNITTRSAVGRPLSYAEMDGNFNNLNTGKAEVSVTDSLQQQTTTLAQKVAFALQQITGYATNIGSSLMGFIQAGAGAIARTVQDKLRETVSVVDYGADPTGAVLSDAAFAAAVASGAKRIVVPDGTYTISAPIDIRNKAGFIFEGLGLPVISQTTANTPIILTGGERVKITGVMLQYAAPPVLADTNAVAIRCYNLYESIIERVYLYRTWGGIDQYQGTVNGGQNAFYSNTVRDIRIVKFAGWGIKLVPYQGGNSGNYFENIYINNRSGQLPTDSLACQGGMFLQTSEDGVYNQINIEWMRNSAPAIVLNQCANPVFNGLHFEGLYPTTNYNPLIDIPGGDNSMPMFNGLSVIGSNWGGGVGMGLFRLDNQGTRLYVNGLLTNNNTNLGGMAGLLINGGSTCYGSTIEVINAACDGGFQAGEVTPRISAGSAVAGVAYPLVRYNGYMPSHSALIVDNAGGTQSAGTMAGQVTSVAFDSKSLWNASASRFEAKVPGVYNCSVNIPTGAGCVVYVMVNYTNVAALTLPTAGGPASVSVPLQAGDNVEFYLATGSYTRTNVTFGVSRAS